MNLYQCRFVDSDDEIFYVKQYGNSSWEIDMFWNDWNSRRKKDENRKYIDCKLLEENVKYDPEVEAEYIRRRLGTKERFDLRPDRHDVTITEKHVFFYRNHCPFSNFFLPCRFLYSYQGEMHTFFSSEQAFMWSKAKLFEDEEIAKKILSPEGRDSPMFCKKMGRLVKNYDDEKWSEVRYGIFVQVNLAKFTQNEKLKIFLIDHRFDNKTFVEASPHDKIWGIGMGIEEEGIDDEKNWKGQNLMGKCITEVRDMILKP